MHVVKPAAGWSKSALASEFGIARQTCDKLLRGVAHNGTVAGHPVWRMRDVCGIFADYVRGTESVGDRDPEDLEPKDRLDWYNGEKARIGIEKESRRLIDIDEMGDALAMVFDSLKTFVVTLPDVLERDAALSGEQVQICIEAGDSLLEDFSNKLIGEDAESDAKGS